MEPIEHYQKQYLYQRIVKSKLFIEKHYDERLALDQIAKEANFSKFHFIRLFNNIYGQTPNQYLRSFRIKKAKELLDRGVPIIEICYTVGFESVSTFKALLKERLGHTSSIYKRKRSHKNCLIATKPSKFIPGCLIHKLPREKSNFQDPVQG